MVKAINGMKTSAILIQSKLNALLKLHRSVHEGDLMSPLVFLIVSNVLSWMLLDATTKGQIRGVEIVEIREEFTHGQYTNDTTMIVEAKLEYIEKTFSIFSQMGLASGLYIKETQVKAVFFSQAPRPDWLTELDWNWEDNQHLSKILGFFVGKEIQPTAA